MRMRLIGALAAMLLLALSTAAYADLAPAPEAPHEGLSGYAKTAPEPTYTCVPVKGRPDLERAQQEAPPPTGPEGQPTPAHPALCPPGTVGVSKTTPGRKARHPFGGAPVGAAVTAGYFYAGDIWRVAAVGEAFSTQFSSPTVPANASSGAHTVSQLALIGGAEGQYTIEEGWTKEAVDQDRGFKGARLFFFVNPDNYGPRSCYDCGLVLSGASNPFGVHYFPTDGSAESQCLNGAKPCTGRIGLAVEQYKGAWWLWFANEWVGRVSDDAWGQKFKVANEEQVFGEVYDSAAGGPFTPMGNGNKGACVCATEMETPQFAKKPIEANAQPNWSAHKPLHNPPVNVSFPQRYTIGSISTNRQLFHMGG